MIITLFCYSKVGLSQDYDVTRTLAPDEFTSFKSAFTSEYMEEGYTRRIDTEFEHNYTMGSATYDVYWITESGYLEFIGDNDTNDISQANILDEKHYTNVWWFANAVFYGDNQVVYTLLLNTDSKTTEYTVKISQNYSYTTPPNPWQWLINLIGFIGIPAVIIIVIVVIIKKKKNNF